MFVHEYSGGFGELDRVVDEGIGDLVRLEIVAINGVSDQFASEMASKGVDEMLGSHCRKKAPRRKLFLGESRRERFNQRRGDIWRDHVQRFRRRIPKILRIQVVGYAIADNPQ